MIDIETIWKAKDLAEEVRHEIKSLAFTEDNLADAWNYLNNANGMLLRCEGGENISAEDMKPAVEALNDAIKSLDEYLKKFDGDDINTEDQIARVTEARDLLGGGECGEHSGKE